MLNFDFKKYTKNYITNSDVSEYEEEIAELKKEFTEGNLSQWTSIDTFIDSKTLDDIVETASLVRKNCDVFLVIGIGGSYMGAKAVIEALLPRYNRTNSEVIFLGTNLSSEEYYEIFSYIKDKEVIVNIISKSGNTLEPSIAFDVALEFMKSKYSEEDIAKRIIATTDKEKGSIRELVNQKGYKSFIVPDNVGGRFSVFTPVGLLPIAVAGVDIKKLLEGVLEGIKYLDNAIEYAVLRDILYNEEDKYVEVYTIYNEKLYYFSEWLKQLFGETQGKDGCGIFPASCVNTRDLHSLGQYLQDGENILFETVINIKEEINVPIFINKYKKNLSDINNIAVEKVAEAHTNGETPSIIIEMNKKDEFHLGMIMQFFMLGAIAGAILLDVNPFNQEGVEEYKKLLSEELN